MQDINLFVVGLSLACLKKPGSPRALNHTGGSPLALHPYGLSLFIIMKSVFVNQHYTGYLTGNNGVVAGAADWISGLALRTWIAVSYLNPSSLPQSVLPTGTVDE